jgi:hypothetical protein
MPPSVNGVEQRHRPCCNPDQAGARSRENEAERAGDDWKPTYASAAEQDGGEADAERERGERGEVRVTEEGRLTAPCCPRVGDIEAEELQQREQCRGDAPRHDRRGHDLPVVPTSQDQRRRDREQGVLGELHRGHEVHE